MCTRCEIHKLIFYKAHFANIEIIAVINDCAFFCFILIFMFVVVGAIKNCVEKRNAYPL